MKIDITQLVVRFNNTAILFSSGANKVRKCLLSFGAESFVFQFAIHKFKDKDI